MIGLLFLAGIALWVTVAVMLSRRIPSWLGATQHRALLSVASFCVILLAPVADELIGRWQFYRLCEREAVVWLSPDWRTVKAVRHNDPPVTELMGFAVPIRVQGVEYLDASTGKPFLSFKGFHTSGGLLFGRFGLGLGLSTSCWPKNKTQLLNELNIDQLLKQGK